MKHDLRQRLFSGYKIKKNKYKHKTKTPYQDDLSQNPDQKLSNVISNQIETFYML